MQPEHWHSRRRAMGSILPEHHDGLLRGWQHWLERIRDLAQRKNRKGIN
jgi:hypothetical protein